MRVSCVLLFDAGFSSLKILDQQYRKNAYANFALETYAKGFEDISRDEFMKLVYVTIKMALQPCNLFIRLNHHGSAFLMWSRQPLNNAAERINLMDTNYEMLSSDIRHSLALIELVKARKAKFLMSGDNYEFIFDLIHDQIIDLLDTRTVKKFLPTNFPEEINRPFRHRYTSDFQVIASKLCVPVLELLRDAKNWTVPLGLDS